MAVGTQFSALLDMLLEELGLTTNVAVGVDARPGLKRNLNRAYQIVAEAYSWPHLRVLPTRIPLAEGQRFYDLPQELDVNDVDEIIAWQGNLPHLLERGVSYEEYAVFDSENDVRSSPPQKWDWRFDGNVTQLEIWPIPTAGDMLLALTGTHKTPKLVNDADKCLLDDELVVLAAAVRVLKRQGSKDADSVASEYEARLRQMKSRTGPSKTVVMGDAGERTPRRATITIAGR